MAYLALPVFVVCDQSGPAIPPVGYTALQLTSLIHLQKATRQWPDVIHSSFPSGLQGMAHSTVFWLGKEQSTIELGRLEATQSARCRHCSASFGDCHLAKGGLGSKGRDCRMYHVMDTGECLHLHDLQLKAKSCMRDSHQHWPKSSAKSRREGIP